LIFQELKKLRIEMIYLSKNQGIMNYNQRIETMRKEVENIFKLMQKGYLGSLPAANSVTYCNFATQALLEANMLQRRQADDDKRYPIYQWMGTSEMPDDEFIASLVRNWLTHQMNVMNKHRAKEADIKEKKEAIAEPDYLTRKLTSQLSDRMLVKELRRRGYVVKAQKLITI
jgi:hypothetical protein